MAAKAHTLVIVGHGMVAQRLLEELIDAEAQPFSRILVIGDEPTAAYNRVLLSSVLSGEAEADSLALKPTGWFEKHGIQRMQGDPVVGIDRQKQCVITRCGHREPYDRLVLATGARPGELGIEGEALDGIMSFRDLRDTRELIRRSRQSRRAVVIGGGFLGLEAADALSQRGMEVSVLHRSGHLLNRQLDPTGGALLAGTLEKRGIHIHTYASPRAFTGKGRVQSVELTDGRTLSADLVVVAAGIVPNADIACAAGLECGHAIRVNGRLQTSDGNIFALGECCEMERQTFGLVEPGYQQARVLAGVLCQQQPATEYRPGPVATRLKISGIPIFSCGQTDADEDTETVVWHDLKGNRYCRLLIRNQRLRGVILYGDTRDGNWYSEQIRNQTDISAQRPHLAFGPEFCAAAA